MGWFCALALLVGLWLLMIAPGRAPRDRRAPFEGRAFAHRGLYELDEGRSWTCSGRGTDRSWSSTTTA